MGATSISSEHSFETGISSTAWNGTFYGPITKTIIEGEEMKGNPVSRMLADIVKNPVEASAFLENPDQYLAKKGITLHEQEMWILKGFAQSLLKPSESRRTMSGGHADSNTHTDYIASDGHYNWGSHLDHTNFY